MALTDLIPWRGQSSLTRPDWDPVISMQREMNRLFDDLWSGGGRSVRSSHESFVPTLDVAEVDHSIRIMADLPGLREKDIKVTLSDDGDVLTLEGEKKHDAETRAESMYRAERDFGRFRRVVALPGRVNKEKVDAKYHDGVLTIQLTKLPEKDQHVHVIPVRAG